MAHAENLRHTLREKHFDLVIDMQGLSKVLS